MVSFGKFGELFLLPPLKVLMFIARDDSRL